MILYTVLLAADSLTRALGALPAGVTDGYASTIRGARFSYQSAHPTDHASLLVRSVDSTDYARWLTAPVGTGAGTVRHIVFLAAINVAAKGAAPVRFWLTVNGTHRVVLPQPTTTAPQWTVAGDDGIDVHFHRLMIDRYGDVHGTFTLDVPATLAPTGSPLTLQVQGESVGRQDWFIIYTVSMQPTIAAHGEQMLARGANGLQQTVRFDAWHPFDTTSVVVSAGGLPPDTEHVAVGATTFRIAVPAVQAPTPVAITVKSSSATATFAALSLGPVVPRTIYLINHDHLDIGYTDVQPAVRARHERALDSAMAYIDRSRRNPPGSHFLWNEEGLWPLQNYLATRPAADTARLLADVRHGDMALSAVYANLMTGLSSGEELVHLLDYARTLRRDDHVPVTMAMTSDVPGFTWGMVPALSHQGIRYLSSGPNETDRIGHTLEAWGDKPFWWIGPSGEDSLLVMFAGRGYSWVNGWPQGRLTLEDANVMSDYMDTLVTRHYPWDIVQVRVAIAGDNGMPDGQLADEVRQWNGRYVSPKLVIATLPQMFQAMEQQYGAALPRIQGDLTGYWEDGALSTLREEMLARASAARLVQAGSLAALRNVAVPAANRDAAWRDVLLWDEHTWGADRSISEPDSPMTIAQWQYKQRFAIDADSASRALLDQAARSATTGHGVELWNTHSVAQSGVVVIPDSLSRTGDIAHDSKRRVLPSQRLHDGALAVRIDLAPMSATRVTLVHGAVSRDGAERAHAAGDSLWNGRITVHVDSRTGAIASVRWRGHELVDHARGGWGRYRYVLGRDTSRARDASNVEIDVLDNGPLVATLRITADAPGSALMVRYLTIDAGSDVVQLLTHLDKNAVRDKAGVHIGFPLAVPGGTVRMEQGWAVVRPDVDQAPGANRNLYPVQRWLDASNADFGVTVLTPDLPLWELNGLTAEAFEQPDGREEWLTHSLPGTELIAYVMNNYWHTNFKADQSGPVDFRIVLVPHGKFDAATATQEAMALSEMPLALRAPTTAVRTPGWRLDNDSVVVSSVTPSRDGNATMVRLWNPASNAVLAGFEWNRTPAGKVWLSSPSEERGAPAPARLEVPGMGVMTVRVETGQRRVIHRARRPR